MRGLFGAMAVGFLCAVAASSCGGASGTCGAIAPCGGDPVGTWTFREQCTTDPSSGVTSFCSMSTSTVSDLQTTGTLTMGADNSYTVDLLQTGSVVMKMPISCLMMGGITLTCGQLQQFFQTAVLEDPETPFTNVTCTGTGACTCTSALSAKTNRTGTWVVQGTKISLSSGDVFGDFCVKDPELHLITYQTTMPMGLMGQMTITTDLVAVRQ